jgi:hypothetical protein
MNRWKVCVLRSAQAKVSETLYLKTSQAWWINPIIPNTWNHLHLRPVQAKIWGGRDRERERERDRERDRERERERENKCQIPSQKQHKSKRTSGVAQVKW